MLKLTPLTKSKKKRLTEGGKNVLIVLLAVSLLFLLGKTGAFSILGDSGMLGSVISSKGTVPESAGYTAAASPLYIVVTPNAGAHCAVMYDADALAETYGKFSPSLGQALGSAAKEPVAVTEDDWRAALSGCGVYFDFYSDQLISALAGWLGVQLTGGIGTQTARRICLAQDGDGVALYFIRAREPDEIYRCDTALQWSAISDKIGEGIPNGAQYNFELEEPFSAVDAYAVILPDRSLAVPALAATNPLLSAGDELILSAFGLNGYSPYTETDGTVVYIEGDATLRIRTDGTVTYSSAASGGQAEENLTPAAAIDMARGLCADTIGKNCGEASFRLSFVYLDTEQNSYTVKFDYEVNGMPVFFPDEMSAAEITIANGTVAEARLVFRQYSPTGETEKPLPPIQAAAVVQASGGGEPVLSYLDNMSSAAACWKIN